MTTTVKFVPLAVQARINVPCGECADRCTSHPLTLPVGTMVLARGVQGEWGFIVNGIARPSMHGGGVHMDVTHAETGVRFNGIVGGVYTAS